MFEKPNIALKFEPKEITILKEKHLKIVDTGNVDILVWNRIDLKDKMQENIVIGTPSFFRGKNKFIARRIY